MNMVQAVVDPQVSRMIEQYDTKHKKKKGGRGRIRTDDFLVYTRRGLEVSR